MDQAEIDALLKDSMFEDSEIRQSTANAAKTVKDSEADEYGDEFESYDESRRTFKNASKTGNFDGMQSSMRARSSRRRRS